MVVVKSLHAYPNPNLVLFLRMNGATKPDPEMDRKHDFLPRSILISDKN
jgi:hypothetical protein